MKGGARSLGPGEVGRKWEDPRIQEVEAQLTEFCGVPAIRRWALSVVGARPVMLWAFTPSCHASTLLSGEIENAHPRRHVSRIGRLVAFPVEMVLASHRPLCPLAYSTRALRDGTQAYFERSMSAAIAMAWERDRLATFAQGLACLRLMFLHGVRDHTALSGTATADRYLIRYRDMSQLWRRRLSYPALGPRSIHEGPGQWWLPAPSIAVRGCEGFLMRVFVGCQYRSLQ